MNSRPSRQRSISTCSSYARAAATAKGISDACPTIERPTEDPTRDGFTTTGTPSVRSSASEAGHTAHAGVGMPRSRNRRFAMSLSIATALPSGSLPV